MTNNDILRRIRYTLDMGDDKVIDVFSKGDLEVTREQVCNWLRIGSITDLFWNSARYQWSRTRVIPECCER